MVAEAWSQPLYAAIVFYVAKAGRNPQPPLHIRRVSVVRTACERGTYGVRAWYVRRASVVRTPCECSPDDAMFFLNLCKCLS